VFSLRSFMPPYNSPLALNGAKITTTLTAALMVLTLTTKPVALGTGPCGSIRCALPSAGVAVAHRSGDVWMT
jgi:hypothetical protein